MARKAGALHTYVAWDGFAALVKLSTTLMHPSLSQPKLTEAHFERALSTSRPSVPTSELARLGRM